MCFYCCYLYICGSTENEINPQNNDDNNKLNAKNEFCHKKYMLMKYNKIKEMKEQQHREKNEIKKHNKV